MTEPHFSVKLSVFLELMLLSPTNPEQTLYSGSYYAAMPTMPLPHSGQDRTQFG